MQSTRTIIQCSPIYLEKFSPIIIGHNHSTQKFVFGYAVVSGRQLPSKFDFGEDFRMKDPHKVRPHFPARARESGNCCTILCLSNLNFLSGIDSCIIAPAMMRYVASDRYHCR